MTVNVGDVLEMTLRADFDGVEDVLNVFQFQYLTSAPAADADVLDDLLDLAEAIVNIIKNLSTALVVWRSIRGYNVTTDILLGVSSFASPIAGVNAGDSGVPGVCGLVTFPTNRPRVVMRKFVGVLSESIVVNAGVLGATFVDTLVDLGEYLTQTQTVNGRAYRYGYLSPKVGSFIDPVSAVITNIPAYQRRRRQGRGS